MLAELDGFLVDFIGVCLRGAFGRNAKGQPDPNNPTNRYTDPARRHDENGGERSGATERRSRAFRIG